MDKVFMLKVIAYALICLACGGIALRAVCNQRKREKKIREYREYQKNGRTPAERKIDQFREIYIAQLMYDKQNVVYQPHSGDHFCDVDSKYPVDYWKHLTLEDDFDIPDIPHEEDAVLPMMDREINRMADHKGYYAEADKLAREKYAELTKAVV